MPPNNPDTEENKALLSRFYDEFFNSGYLDVAEEIISPDCPLYFGSMFVGTGPVAFEQFRAMMYGGFPDLHVSIEEMVGQGEKVAQRLTARGTHEGMFMGVAPTGKRIEWQGQAIFHIFEGKVLECRGMPDMLGLLQQIGAIAAPEPAGEVDARRKQLTYARATNIRFSPTRRTEVVRVAQSFAPILEEQRGFKSLSVLTDSEGGEGTIISTWKTEADAEASETSPAYINQMSMMSSFLYAPLVPRTYEVNVRE